MNFSDIRYFIENQLREAEQHPDSPEAGEALLLVADYLMEQVQAQPDAFTKTSGRELRRNFLRCGSIARRTAGFADQYSAPVAQEAASSLDAVKENSRKMEKIQEDCKTAEENLSILQQQEEKIREQNQILQKDNTALLTQEKTLLERKQESETLRQRIQECSRILEEVTDQKLENMRRDLEQTEPDALALKEKQNALLKKLQEAQIRIQNLTEDIDRIQQQTRQIQEKQIPEAEKQLAEIRSQNRAAAQTSSELLAAITEAGAEYEEFQALLEENQRIADRLLESGFVLDDRKNSDSFYARVDAVNRRAKEITEEYNTLLRNVITDARTLYQKILDRQEPAYKG